MTEHDSMLKKMQAHFTSVYNKLGRPLSKYDETGDRKIFAARLRGDFNRKDSKSLSKWKNAEGWRTLVQLNREYIRGELDFAPYHMGPLKPETTDMVPDLLELHDYGLVTYQSQSAGTDGPQVRYRCCGHSYWHIGKKRPYLSFLLPKRLINMIAERLDEDGGPSEVTGDLRGPRISNFLEAMLKDEDIYVSIMEYEALCQHLTCVVTPVIRSSFPKDWQTHMVKEAGTEEELDQIEEFKPDRIIDPNCGCILDTIDSTSNNHVSQEKPLIVHVLARSYDEPDLPGHVLRLLEDANVHKYFEEDEDDEPGKGCQRSRWFHKHCDSKA